MRIELVPATGRHIAAIDALRPGDTAEILAQGFENGRAAALDSLMKSDVAGALLFDDCVAAVGGFALQSSSLLGPRSACCWLLTTPLVRWAPMALHRAGRAWVAEAERRADVLWNYVDARYGMSLKWLEALGFKVHPAVPYGVSGELFHLVTRRSAAWAR